MATRNIYDFFRPKSKPTPAATPLVTSPLLVRAANLSPAPVACPIDSARAISGASSTPTARSSGTITSSELSTGRSSTTGTQSPSPEETAPSNPPAARRIIKSSDDEGSDSDDSFDDPLALLFQSHAAKAQSLSPRSDRYKYPRNETSRPARRGGRFPLSPPRPKYNFDLKRILSQEEKDDAADASALRVRALLDAEEEARENTSGNLLDLAVNADGENNKEVMQALQRTEATHVESRCYLFEAQNSLVVSLWPGLEGVMLESWQEELADPYSRNQTILSGFARDMVTLGSNLPDEIFVWMLDEMCFESREDLRHGYADVLVASRKQIFHLIRPEMMDKVFRNLGVTQNSVDVSQKLRPSPTSPSRYEGRDWSRVRHIIEFFGEVSSCLSSSSKSHGLSLLTRLLADRIMLENIGLLATVQSSIVQFSRNVDNRHWEQCCQSICSSIYSSLVELPTIQLQIIRCIPYTTYRLHDLRRRTALACFYEDVSLSTRTPEIAVDVLDLAAHLTKPQFEIRRDTDYHTLGAQISMLDIIVDNGLSAEFDMSDPAAEDDFNSAVDALVAEVQRMASNIFDAGASFMSRIEAREVLDGFRYRLVNAVRTKVPVKLSIFEMSEKKRAENIEDKRKQSAFMEKHFGGNKFNPG